MKCLMIGPGAIGLTVGTALLDNGHTVHFGARTSFGEVNYLGPDDVARSHLAIALTNPNDVEGPYDFVFLATKVHQTEGASAWFEKSVGPNTVVVVLQNGIQHFDTVAPYIQADAAVVPVVIMLPARRLEPGSVHNTAPSRLEIPDDEASSSVAELFRDSFIAIKQTDDWHTAAWGKLMMNAASGLIATLARKPLSSYVDDEARDLFRALLEETKAVAIADGANIKDGTIDFLVSLMTSGNINHLPSIAVDRINGLRTEWQIRNQVVVDKAAEYGIDAPLSKMGTTLMRLGEPNHDSL